MLSCLCYGVTPFALRPRVRAMHAVPGSGPGWWRRRLPSGSGRPSR
jgi:hypothetical protein